MIWAAVLSFLRAQWRQILIVAIVFAALTWIHHRGYEAGKAAQGAKDAKALTASARALDAANASLNAAGDALTQQNEEANREVLRAQQAQQEADAAAKVALQAQDAAQRRMKSFDRDLQNARANPSCDALLRADVARVCGL